MLNKFILQNFSLSIRLFLHCLKIIIFFKSSSFKKCIRLIQISKNNLRENDISIIEVHRISKRINFINKCLMHNSCLLNSLCLFTFCDDIKGLEFVIGVKQEANEISSHSWVTMNGEPINQKRRVINYEVIFKT